MLGADRERGRQREVGQPILLAHRSNESFDRGWVVDALPEPEVQDRSACVLRDNQLEESAMSSARWGQLLLVAATLGFVAGCGSDDEDSDNANPDPCDQVDCGSHGTCSPETGICECDMGYLPEGDGCVAAECSGNAACDDGNACNGEETCTSGKCQGGTPVSCSANATCQDPDGTCACDDGYHDDGDQCLADECSGNDDCEDGVVCNGQETCNGGICEAGTAVSCQENAICQEPDGTCVCDSGFVPDGSVCVAELEIIGDWIDDWAIFHDVAQDTWTMDGSVFHITQFDNDADFLVAQNDAANAWNPELWSRFDWTFDSSALYYCQIAYDAPDEATAAANSAADRADLATGCGGFSWSKLNPN